MACIHECKHCHIKLSTGLSELNDQLINLEKRIDQTKKDTNDGIGCFLICLGIAILIFVAFQLPALLK